MILKKRQFLKIAGIVVLAALASFVWSYPSYAQVTIKMMSQSHFVPGFNEELVRQANEWARRRGVKVEIDYIPRQQLPAKLATEAEAKTGHDIILLWHFETALRKENLAVLDDICADLEVKYGSWSDTAKFLNYIDGHWRGLAWQSQSGIANINIDHWYEIGMEPDQVANLDWQGLLEAAKKLHKIGHPVALAITEDLDSYMNVFPVFWDYGSRWIDSDGSIKINSPETEFCLSYFKELFQYMPQEMIGWDGGGNNKELLSGRGSWTVNPPSIWASAKIKELPIAEKLTHVPLPSGPGGRYRNTDVMNLGIWSFSPNIDLAKDLLRFLLEKEQVMKQIGASWGYNEYHLATYRTYPVHPIFEQEPALKYYQPAIETIVPAGWPAPPSPETTIAYNLRIVPMMVVKAVTGADTVTGAVEWAEKQLKRIYGQ